MEQHEELIVEPIRKSLLDVQLENLLDAQRKIFINRVIFIGEHSFDDKHEIAKAFNEITRNQMPGTFTEQLSGILLYYDMMFCVLVEGADNDIHYQIKRFIDRTSNKLKRNKILISIHHISERVINNWICCNSNPPPSTTDIIDDSKDMETTINILQNCILKLHSFAECYENGSLFLIDHMPEVKVLDYLLNSPYLETLIEFSVHVNQIERTTISDQIWPAPTLYMPHDLFDQSQKPQVIAYSNIIIDEEETEESINK